MYKRAHWNLRQTCSPIYQQHRNTNQDYCIHSCKIFTPWHFWLCSQCVCCCCWLHCANLPSSTHLNIYLSIFNPFSFLCTMLGLNFLQNDFVTTTRISFSPLETIGNPDIKRWKCIYACEFSADRQISTNTQNKCSVSEYVPFLFSLWWNYLFNTMCIHAQTDVSKQASSLPNNQPSIHPTRNE